MLAEQFYITPFVNSHPGPCALIAADAPVFTIVQANGAFKAIAGYEFTGEVMNQSLRLIFRDELTFGLQNMLKEMRAGRIPTLNDIKTRSTSGSTWMVRLLPITDKFTETTYILIFPEICQPKSKPDEKPDQQVVPEFFCIMDTRREIVQVSDTIKGILGYTPEEVVGTQISSLVHTDDLNTLQQNSSLLGSRKIRFKHKNGLYKPLLWMSNLGQNESRSYGIGKDMLGMSMKAQFWYSQQHDHDIFENMIEGCQIINFNWQYVYLNPTSLKQSRKQEHELLGKSMMEAYPGIEDTPLFAILRKSMKERVTQTIENKFMFPDGSTGWFELRIQPFPEGLCILSFDITERKKQEDDLLRLNKDILDLNANLEQKVFDRTESLQLANTELEAFTYAVSHDLRAPLRAINGYARIIEEDYQSLFDADGKRILGLVQHNARQMGILIDELLNFSRLGRKELHKVPVNMEEMVTEIAEEIVKQSSVPVTIHVRNLPVVNADHMLLRQVWINYIQNAVKYSSGKPEPVVEISCIQHYPVFIFAVTDNGAGFDMNYYHKLFGVFQRLHTKEEFEGTGVGLAVVKRIVEKHHGKVWAESVLNQGASFYFSLPLNSET